MRSIDPGAPGDRPDPIAEGKAAHYLPNLPHPQLPIGHGHLLFGQQTTARAQHLPPGNPIPGMTKAVPDRPVSAQPGQ